MSAWPYTPKIPPMALYVFTPRRQPSNPTTPRDSPVPTDKGANAGLKVTSLVAGIQASTSAASLPSPPTPANPFDLAGAMGASREFVEQVTKMQQDFFQHLTGALSAEDPSA